MMSMAVVLIFISLKIQSHTPIWMATIWKKQHKTGSNGAAAMENHW